MPCATVSKPTHLPLHNVMNTDQSQNEEHFDEQLMDALLREQEYDQREQSIREIENAIMKDAVVHPIDQPNVDWKRLMISGSVAAAVVLGFGYFLGASLHPQVDGGAVAAKQDDPQPMLITYKVKYIDSDLGVVETELPREVVHKHVVVAATSEQGDDGSQPFPEIAISPLSPELGDPRVSDQGKPQDADPVVPTPWRLVDQNWRTPLSQPLSSFSMDVENASYANIRHLIRQGHPIPEDVVFVEECINAFAYDYAGPGEDKPFAVHSNIMTCPWNDRHMLVKVAIKARDLDQGADPAVVAKNAGVQIEFNPQRVESYRLIGYANCLRDGEDLEAIRANSLDIRAGHVVTALYEVMPLCPVMATPRPGESLKYQRPVSSGHVSASKDEWLNLNLTYKLPAEDKVSLQQNVLKGEATLWHLADVDSRFASTVALFGMKLRGMDGLEGITWDHVLAMAEYGVSTETHDDRAEFIGLVKALKSQP